MDAHQNARTTCHGRMLIVEHLAAGWIVTGIAGALGVGLRTVRKGCDRVLLVLLERRLANIWFEFGVSGFRRRRANGR